MTTRIDDEVEKARRAERALDSYLAAAAQTGDRRAMAALAARFEKRLLRHAYRLIGEAEAARDVAQEAWIDIVRSLPRLDDSAAFAAVAFRIVTRRAADHVRKNVRQRKVVAALAAEPRADFESAREMEGSGEAATLERAMQTLSNEQRAAIALFYQEDMSVAEIAVALAIPAGTVKTRLMAAREKLKAVIEAEEK